MIPAQRVQVPVCMCHLATQHSSNSFVLLPAGGLLVQRGGRGHRDPAQPLQGGHPPDDGGDAAGAHLACPAAGAAQGCTPLAGRGGAGSARSRGSPPEVTGGQLGFRELCLCVVNSASPGSVQGAGGCKSRRSHGEDDPDEARSLHLRHGCTTHAKQPLSCLVPQKSDMLLP